MVEPISPNQAKTQAIVSFPDQVIEAFNELVVKNLRGNSATILQKDVVALIIVKMGISEDKIFQNGWLDVEDVFRAKGWKVEFDKPGYCETYDASFRFSIPR